MKSKLRNAKEGTASGRSKPSTQAYAPGSIWEHLMYGAGTIIFLLGPALIPGLDARYWILAFFAAVMTFFAVVCLLGAWKGIRGHGHPHR